jgi:hypothetical protein
MNAQFFLKKIRTQMLCSLSINNNFSCSLHIDTAPSCKKIKDLFGSCLVLPQLSLASVTLSKEKCN